MSLDNYRTALLAAGHELSAYEKLLIILLQMVCMNNILMDTCPIDGRSQASACNPF